MRELAEWINVRFGQRDNSSFARARLVGNVIRDVALRSWPSSRAKMQLEALASANRSKDEILAIVAHELRSPLASVRYAVRLVGMQMGDAPAQLRLQELIERQLARMTDLVDELLDLSRITSGQVRLQHERLDLRVTVSNAIETLEPQINERRHLVSTELPDQPVWLQADPGRLEQVFVNLLANAARYSDPGAPLAVGVHVEDAHAVVRIRDAGVGIASEALPHIFELFKQSDAADPHSRSGLGIGLAVVRKLVELHGGSVLAASAGCGQGSEFTVRLPTENRQSVLASA